MIILLYPLAAKGLRLLRNSVNCLAKSMGVSVNYEMINSHLI